jgi:hypothetical protein
VCVCKICNHTFKYSCDKTSHAERLIRSSVSCICFPALIILHQNVCTSSMFWMLKSHIQHGILTYLRWLMRVEATPCCLMVWWDSDTFVSLATVTLDTMQCERGAAHQQSGKSIPRTHHSRRLAGQTNVNAPTPIDRGCPEWDTLLVPWTSSRCEVRSLCSKG